MIHQRQTKWIHIYWIKMRTVLLAAMLFYRHIAIEDGDGFFLSPQLAFCFVFDQPGISGSVLHSTTDRYEKLKNKFCCIIASISFDFGTDLCIRAYLVARDCLRIIWPRMDRWAAIQCGWYVCYWFHGRCFFCASLQRLRIRFVFFCVSSSPFMSSSPRCRRRRRLRLSVRFLYFDLPLAFFFFSFWASAFLERTRTFRFDRSIIVQPRQW